ncbi:hypothetical protein [Streptomyces sp. MP131-18]|uniref:imine reductase family protein n=1 Tax=Streptomyces sp. MP131-18 TaxID=1857892 RepID=UPI00097CAEBF|nr:hypothetical protein [Streptomyces sp. MP131-18]ONK16123.1 hypothetical protein STBA_69730 [Streptomyces sp. MP131-18]
MNSPDHSPGSTIAITGSSPRGAALAGALAEPRRPVTAWHPDRDDDAVLASASFVLLCAEDPAEAARALRHLAASPLAASCPLVNFTSGTGEQAREASAVAAERGNPYLHGALMAHPEHVGHPDTVLVYSGSGEAFRQHEERLRRLGGATYLGPDAATASLYDVALLNLAWATLLGFLQTAALLGTAGVRARTVSPLLTHWLATTVSEVIADYAGQVDDGVYPGDEEWLDLDAPLMDHLVTATEAGGLDPALPLLIRTLTRRGTDAGHGRDSFASLIEVIKD